MKESLRNVGVGSAAAPLLISNILSFDNGPIKTKILKIQKIFNLRFWLNRLNCGTSEIRRTVIIFLRSNNLQIFPKMNVCKGSRGFCVSP